MTSIKIKLQGTETPKRGERVVYDLTIALPDKKILYPFKTADKLMEILYEYLNEKEGGVLIGRRILKDYRWNGGEREYQVFKIAESPILSKLEERGWMGADELIIALLEYLSDETHNFEIEKDWAYFYDDEEDM
jgi:hypothetical protein